MTSGSRSKQERDNESRRVHAMRETIEDLQDQIEERRKALHTRGVRIDPAIVDACKLEVLIRWAAPSEYARARFDLQACEQLLAQLQDDVVDPLMEEKIKTAKAIAEAQQMAREGKTQEGLYIPGTDEVIAATQDADPTSPPTGPRPGLHAVPGVIGPPPSSDRS